MTVQELREVISNLPDDGEVYVQRIEDKFEKNGWTIKPMKGEWWHYLDNWNSAIDSGKYLDKEAYPNMKPEMLVKATEDQFEDAMEQYIKTHCCINYDGKNLYITSHY